MKVIVYIIMLLLMLCTIWFSLLLRPFAEGSAAVKDQVRIECILHADVPAVRAICTKDGWSK